MPSQLAAYFQSSWVVEASCREVLMHKDGNGLADGEEVRGRVELCTTTPGI